MAPQQSNYVRVSYVIPPPTQTPPRLALPPLGADRNGSIRPLLVPAPPSTPTSQSVHVHLYSDGHTRAPVHPRHRLGVSSLALDSSTQLSGKECPEGILYSGGRDGQIIAWELGLKTRQRRHRYPYGEGNAGGNKGRWEIMTGWGDDMEEETESDEEVTGSDGDVLGDVVESNGSKRQKNEALMDVVTYENAWELDAESSFSHPSAFRQCIQTHTDWVNDVLLCNLNQTVVSASSDGSIRAWSPHLTSSIDPVLVGMHDDYVRCLTTSTHQPWIASGSFDRCIKLWDLSRTISPSSATDSRTSSANSPSPLVTLSLPVSSQKSSIYAIATDHFGSIIASGSPERVVRMWDPRTAKRTGKLVGHTDNIRAIVLSADGRYLLTGSADASIKLWSLAAQRCLHTFAHHTESVWALSSQHPSLEIFYSGDRSGIVSRVDMEGCNTVDEGECLVVCNATRNLDADNAGQDGRTSGLGDVFRLQDGTGVNKIVTIDDRLVWTATGSSSIKRWKAPPRRSLRTGTSTNTNQASPYNPTFGASFSSNSRRTSGSSDVHSPRRFGMGFESSRKFIDDAPSASSPTSPRSGKRLSNPMFSNATDPLAQDESSLFGIPYQSLVRLVFPTDPYAVGSPISRGGYGGISRGHGEADVATLYSAASVKSIPLPVARHSHPPLVGGIPKSATPASFRQSTGSTLSPRFAAMSPDGPEATWAPSPRTEYESRDLAATAVPLELYPDDVIQGEHGLVRSLILNDRMHALTINTAGCVAVWDIARCSCVGWYDRADVLAEMGCVNGTDENTESDNEFLSPRELLETVRERIEGECFETEIYADEGGYGNERRYDTEQRLNVGKWVLSNVFDNFVREELRILRGMSSSASHASSHTHSNMHRGGSVQHTAADSRPTPPPVNEARNRSLSLFSITSDESHVSRTAVSTVVTAPLMTPIVLPDMSLIEDRRTSASLILPHIPIVPTRDEHLSPIPQSPLNIPPGPAGTPTPRPRQPSETPSTAKNASNKESDYFSLRTQRLSNATTPDDFSGWSGPASKEKDKDLSIPQTPSTPSGGGFMGRLRHFGKSSKRPLSAEMNNTSGGSAVPRPSESQDGVLQSDQANATEPETEQSRFLGSLTSQAFHPPATTDAPPLSLSLDTEIVLAEETQFGWSNIYRGTIASTGQDRALLEKVMPLWLMHYLFTNKIPIVPNIKVSFGVAAWTGKETSGASTNDAAPARLTANRYLRVRKILAYVQDKIDKPPSRSASRSGSISGASPRSSMDAPRTSRSGSTSSHRPSSSSHKSDIEGPKKARPEDIYELMCNDVVLPLNMTLATIRHYVWRSAAEVLMHYRRKV